MNHSILKDNNMKKFLVVAWQMRMDFESQYAPYLQKIESVIKAHSESAARWKMCANLNWTNVKKLSAVEI